MLVWLKSVSDGFHAASSNRLQDFTLEDIAFQLGQVEHSDLAEDHPHPVSYYRQPP